MAGAVRATMASISLEPESDEVRLLLEIDGSARPVETVSRTVDSVMEAVRRDLGIRVEVMAVPARSLPRYELKARRVVWRASETPDARNPQVGEGDKGVKR